MPKKNKVVKKGAKKGAKKGSKRRESNLTRGDWFKACEEYSTTSTKWKSKKAFLLSNTTSNKFVGTDSEIRSFGTWLVKHRAGTLKPTYGDSKRERKPGFPEVEEMLVGYIELRMKKFQHDKLGISWQIMGDKALEYADKLAKCGVQGLDHFQASSGWIGRVLERNSLSGMNLHGEAKC
jgi:hypothetical protein